jgi:hypothetical protein
LHVVICSEAGRNYGFVVDRIIDIVEESARIEKRSGRPGVSGAAVIRGRVTELLEPSAIIQTLHPIAAAAA